MRNITKTAIFIALVSVLFVVSCGNPVAPDGPGANDAVISLTGGGFTVERIDTSYWTSTPPGATMFVNLWVQYEEDLDASDIDEALVTDPNGIQWTLEAADLTINSTNKSIKATRLWNGDSASTVPLGIWTVLIKLVNGETDAIVVIVTEPAATSYPTHDYAAVTVTDAVTEVEMLAPASIQSATRDANGLTVGFSMSDDRVRNAYLWFYDTQHQYLGSSGFLLNNDGTLKPVLDTFDTTGSTCTVTIDSATIVNTTLPSWSDIAECIVVVTDGAQYDSNYTYYDYKAIGPRQAVTFIP